MPTGRCWVVRCMSDDVDRAQAREEELLADALARQARRARAAQGLPAGEFCGEHLDGGGCGEPIAAARRAAVPGCQLCVACQGRREKSEGVR